MDGPKWNAPLGPMIRSTIGGTVDGLAVLSVLLMVAGCAPTTSVAPPTETLPAVSTAPATHEPGLATATAPMPTVTSPPTATPSSPAPEASGPTRIEFGKGQTSATFTGTLHVGETKQYALYAFAGQTMRVYAEPLGAELAITGEDGTVLHAADDPHPFWRGQLPSTQNYQIDVTHSSTAIGPWDAPLRLEVVIVPAGKTTEQLAYADEANGFSLSYSDYFAEGQWPPVFDTTGENPVLGLIFTGSEYFHNTNLNEAALVVSARAATSDEQDCSLPTAPGGVVSTDHVTVNDVTFSRVEYQDAGAGNFYDVVVHTVRHGPNCYAISFYFHSGNIANYPPGISEFDHQAVLNLMRDVLSSFRFLGG
jgi:hypothetical protein